MPSRKRAGPSGFMVALRGQRLCSRRAPSSLNPSILTISRLGRVTYPSRHSKVYKKYLISISLPCFNFSDAKSWEMFLPSSMGIQLLLPLVPRSTTSDRLPAHAAMKNWIFRVCAAGERSTTGRHATINVPLRLKMVTVHFSRPRCWFWPSHFTFGGYEYGAILLPPLLSTIGTLTLNA